MDAAAEASVLALRYRILEVLLREGPHSIGELETLFANRGVTWASSAAPLVAGQVYTMHRDGLLVLEQQRHGPRRWAVSAAEWDVDGQQWRPVGPVLVPGVASAGVSAG